MIPRGVKDRDVSALFRVSPKTAQPEFRNVVTTSLVMMAAAIEDALVFIRYSFARNGGSSVALPSGAAQCLATL